MCDTGSRRNKKGSVADTIDPQPPSMKDILDIKSMINSINLKVDKIDVLQTAIKDLKDSVEWVAKQYDDILLQFNKTTDEVKVLNNDIIKLKQDNQEKNKLIKDLNTRLINMEQYNRNKNIEIHCIPQRQNENCHQLVLDVAKELGVPITPTDIDVAHRLSAPKNGESRPPAIIAQFTSRTKRDLLLQKRCLIVKNKNIPGTSLGNKIYLNENLTPYNKAFIYKARQQAKAAGIKFVWIKNCKLFIRRDSNDPAMRIYNEDDLEKQMSQYMHQIGSS